MESWLDELLNDLNSVSKTHLLELSSIIQRMGMDDKTRNEWISIIKEQVQDTYLSLLDDAKIYQNKLIDSIEQLLQQLQELCKQLHIQMPSHGSENLSLSEEKALLCSRITEYENMVKIRKNELDKLKERQLEACKSLGREPLMLSDSPLPTMDEIDNFANYIEKLEDEKFKREGKFIETKCKILDIVQELDIKPSLEIEKTVCSPDDSLFLVTDYNMKWIDEYHESLVQQRSQTINEITNLREKLRSLWEILSEDIKTSNEFLEKYKGNSLLTLEALQNEVKRCENLKKANIEKFIRNMRDELTMLWEKCHFTFTQREEFQYFYDNLYTEDLLTFHDIEVEKMKKYYKEHRNILTLLESREEYWKKKKELEEKARDPNRYKNRGATLLKEQKELNGVLKKLNDMEQELLVAAQRYEEKYNKPFLSWGKEIAEIIEKTHDDYETEKKNQLSAKKQQRNLAVTPTKSTLFLGSTLSGSKRNLLTLTPSAGMTPQKRKLPPTALFSSNKKKTPLREKNLLDNKKIQSSVNKPVTSERKRPRYSTERKKRMERIRRLSKMLEQQRVKKEETFDYDNFEIPYSNISLITEERDRS